MGQFVLFSSVKNEGPFLVEWVTFHRLIGFDRIVIYSNDCADGTDALLDAMADAGLIEHYPHAPKPTEAPQHRAAADALARGLFQNGDWVMWLDADEFLTVKVGEGALRALQPKLNGADAVAFHWRIFGANGYDGLPTRMVSESFAAASYRKFYSNNVVKTLFRFSASVARLHLHRPVWHPDAQITMLDGSGNPLGPEIVHGTVAHGNPVSRIPVAKGSFHLGQVNHYILRSRQCFELKKARGLGDAPIGHQRQRHTDAFFARHDKTNVPERTILKYEPLLSDAIADVLDEPLIRACHDACVAATKEAITRL